MADIPQKRASKIDEKFTVEKNTLKRAVKDNPKDRIEIEIGDSKQPDFKPQAKISRWFNEVNFSLRAQEHPEAVVRTEGNLIKYITPDYEVHQYELDPGEIGEDGGLEFEWVLPTKPASNVLTATIQTKELDFFYQPALTQEEIDEGADRPENVVGSYAVYHKTKGGMNRADGMEYKTGKAFHIYRPKVTDKKGKETWAELNIDETSGVLSVTVPQEFLDKAVYPVIVDPTFGYTTKGGTSSTNTPGTLDVIFCAQYAIPTSGTLDSVSYYLKQNGTENPDFEFLVYNDGSDYPTSLLATSTSTWRLTDSWDNWKTLNFSSENLVTGNYWLSSFTDGSRGSSEDSFITYYDTISTNRRVSSFNEVAWPTPSDPFPSGKTVATNLKISIYATYSAKFHNLTDNFDDNSINATIWNDDTASETGGQMVVTANTSTGTYNGISSDSRYDLTESYAFIQLVSAGDTSLSFTTYILELYNDTVDLYWAIEYGATDEIVAYKSPNSVDYTEIYRATYDPDVHKWFRIREASGTVYWDTSADGTNWTNRDSDVTGYDLTALNVFFGAENPASGSTTVTFDNFNVAPPLPTANSERDAVITGKDTSNSARAGHLIGKDTSNAARAARLTGQVSSFYTKEVKASLPADDTSLATAYTSQEVTDVATDDATRVPLAATSTDFMVHHYKYYYSTESADQFTVTWNGQSTLAPSSATVYLQVYNHDTPGWETIDSDNATAANTDFDLSATVSTNLANYYDAYYIITCRVYQEIT